MKINGDISQDEIEELIRFNKLTVAKVQKAQQSVYKKIVKEHKRDKIK
jgi:hypothetical protein